MSEPAYKIRFKPERFGGHRALVYSRRRWFGWRYEFWFQLSAAGLDVLTEAREKAERLIPSHIAGKKMAKLLARGLPLPTPPSNEEGGRE